MIRYRTRIVLNLSDVLEQQYFRLNTRIDSEITRRHYRRAVHWLGEMLGRPARVDDLTDSHLVGLLNWLRATRNQAPRTANGTHQRLAALWRWCRDRDLVRGGPTVAALKVAAKVPRCWKDEEITRLVQAADAANGSICGMPARVWWLTLLALEMDTGARAGELLALDWSWIDWDSRTLTVDASVRKGGVAYMVYGLRAETIRWLAAIRKDSGLILAWQGDRSRYYQRWKSLLEAAGLPRGRDRVTHCLRRTFATLLERAGGNATVALGHANRATTLKSYIDPTAALVRHAEQIPFHPLRILADDSDREATG